jgi:hypothetical protein
MARKKTKKNPIEQITSKKKKESPTPEAIEVKEWLEKIRAGQKVKSEWQKTFRVELAYSYRDGVQRPSNVKESEWITINKVFSSLLAELPTLYSTDPYFYIKLAKSYSPHPMDIARFEQNGEIRQSMLNYIKGELKLKAKARISILDAYFQLGCIKTLYREDQIDNPDAGKPATDDNGNELFGDVGQPILEPDTLPVNQAYDIKRIHPDDVWFDEDAGVLEDDWGLIIERIKTPLEDAKKNKKFKQSTRSKLQATEMRTEEDKSKEKRKKGMAESTTKEKADIAVLYEVYDLKEDKWFVVSDGVDGYLIDPIDIALGIENHPYSFLFLGLPRDDSPYWVTPVSQWLDAQREIGELRSKIMVHRKRFNRKYTVWQEGFADLQSAMSQIEVGEDGTVIPTIQPQQSVFPIQDASLDQNHIQELIMLGNDFQELATGQNQRGAGAGVDSATEAGIIEKHIMAREGDRLSMVMDFITSIGRKLDQLVQANITRDQAVKVTGPQGEFWKLVRVADYEEIDGEFEYSVNVGASTPQLPEIERAQFTAVLGLIASAPFLGMSKNLLKRVAELHHIEDEGLINELHQIIMQMMQGQPQAPGGVGSQPNTVDAMTRPASVQGGMAAGVNNVRGGV